MLTTAFTILRRDFSSPLLWIPLVIWLFLMMFAPVARWLWGSAGILVLINLGVLAHAAASLSILLKQWQWKKTLLTVITILPLAWLVEWIGHSTGFPFGDYRYTPLLQPQVGNVPLLIPLAWLMMLPPAWGTVARIVSPKRRLLFAAVAGLAFTAWDLYLDPQMVANNVWVWLQPGEYFGIPLVNYAGWWLVSTVITFIITPRELPERPLGVIYTLTWLSLLIGLGGFGNQTWPALCGFLAMGFFATRFWKKEQWG